MVIEIYLFICLFSYLLIICVLFNIEMLLAWVLKDRQMAMISASASTVHVFAF